MHPTGSCIKGSLPCNTCQTQRIFASEMANKIDEFYNEKRPNKYRKNQQTIVKCFKFLVVQSQCPWLDMYKNDNVPVVDRYL